MCRNRRAHSAGLTSQNWHSLGLGRRLTSPTSSPAPGLSVCSPSIVDVVANDVGSLLSYSTTLKKTNELQSETVLRKMTTILTSSSWERYSLWRAARSRSACSRNQSKSGKWETLEKTGTMQRIFDYDRIRDLSNRNKASHCCLFLAFGWILNNGRWLTK